MATVTTQIACETLNLPPEMIVAEALIREEHRIQERQRLRGSHSSQEKQLEERQCNYGMSLIWDVL